MSQHANPVYHYTPRQSGVQYCAGAAPAPVASQALATLVLLHVMVRLAKRNEVHYPGGVLVG
ncbi:MAG: hypothetical protein M3Z30_02130 [Gemmatimonadota bacterium]|nr:hypothetical protein [Gemmatimonadota bacterium]